MFTQVHSSPYTLQMQRAADAAAAQDTQITQSEMHLEFNDAISKQLPTRIMRARASNARGLPSDLHVLHGGGQATDNDIPSSDDEGDF